MNKSTGSFYTPLSIALFLSEHIMKNNTRKNPILLEPSCGDGIFISALKKSDSLDKCDKLHIDLVDINKHELNKAEDKAKVLKNVTFNTFNQDFLYFQKQNKKRYDIIIGNPPYLKREYLSIAQMDNIKVILKQAGIVVETIRNIWPAFIVSGEKMLSDNGIMGFVLPGELLQVKYAQDIRLFLLNKFQRIEIVVFYDFLFKSLEQNTILLMCYKNHSKKGLFFKKCNKSTDLIKRTVSFQKKDYIRMQKWTSSILTKKELLLLTKIREKWNTVRDYCQSSAGIVTAANNFFIIDAATVTKYDFHSLVTPILQKGQFVNGKIRFTDRDFHALKESGNPCYLLTFNNKGEHIFTDLQYQYINKGIALEINQRYKCRKRPVWYKVPVLKSSEAIFFKRIYKYPKLILNNADILVTDTGYRIQMLPFYKGEIHNFIYSFYNSATLIFCELDGRYYGGGVLELIPNEFKNLPVPYVKISEKRFNHFATDFSNKQTISEILHLNDMYILDQICNFSQTEIKLLQDLREKLLQRRLRNTHPVL